MTIDVAVSSETCVPNAACLRCQAYDPLDCTTTIIDVLGVDLLKTLSVDVALQFEAPVTSLCFPISHFIQPSFPSEL